MGRFTGVAAAAGVVAALAAAPAGAQQSFDLAAEGRNFAKTQERFAHVVGRPDFQLLLREKGRERELQALEILATDRERDFTGNLCWQRYDGCAGEVRLFDWAANGSGIVKPVLFTARNGSTLSGHIWLTAEGPAQRPGVVITTGSVQAPEELYWATAAALAKAGYVVMTWDVQGQGYSDTYGAGADRNDGVPSQSGRPFYDGTEDALDFFFSSQANPYVPRPSCTTGTSHAAKQDRRVAEGRATAYNPAWSLLDTGRIGIAGHSLGAGAVSYVGQLDQRVDAVVAWDNLSDPTAPGSTAQQCASGSSPRPAPLTPRVPALGIANDYGLVVYPFLTTPTGSKSAASRALSAADVDSGQIVIRGGTHFEISMIPNPGFPATLRGNDLAAWYTVAWFDRYVKGGDAIASADARLATDRWRADAANAAVDLAGDGNLFSHYFPSRLDIGRHDGTRVLCEDLRAGCPGLAPDGGPGYDLIASVGTPDAGGPGSVVGPSGQGAPGSTGNGVAVTNSSSTTGAGKVAKLTRRIR